MSSHPHFHNGKYSPKKARKDALKKYLTGTPEYRREIDNIGCVVWGVIITIIVIIFILIAIFSGIDSAIDWVK